MAVGLPLKTTYADGDVYAASDVNDTNGTINLLQTSTFGFAAGKNKIINGDFYINQRGFTSSTVNGFNFDRWQAFLVDGTSTISSQAFTPGTAPVVGYESKSFLRMASTGQTAVTARTSVFQYMEDCRTFAGETVTISFWAKAATGTPNVSVELFRNYGTGGSPSAAESLVSTKLAITSSWARYSTTVSVASLSGKTLGTTDQGHLDIGLWTSAGTNFNARTSSLGIQTVTIDWWGVQIESGSTATAFQTATGTIQGELAACQRYYFRMNGNGNYQPVGLGYSDSTTVARMYVTTPPMRVLPTSLDYTNLSIVADAVYNATAASIGASSPNMVRVDLTGLTGLTAYRSYALLLRNIADQYLGFSAEL